MPKKIEQPASSATALAPTKTKEEVLPPEKAGKTKVAAAALGSTELAVNSALDLEAMATGLENVTSRDIIIPRITLLQGLSPQVDKNDSLYIKGAEIGDFCDVSTGEIFKESLVMIPCYFATVYLEWAPRGGAEKGLQMNHGMDSSILEKCKPDEKRRMVLPNGNLISETATYFVLNLSAGGRRSFIPLSSTQLKNSRKWMTFITNERVMGREGREFMPPIFYRSWTASPIGESNDKGKWSGWKFSPGKTILELDPKKGLLQDAKDFYEQARSGLVKGDLSSYAEDLASGSTAGGPGDQEAM